MARAAAVAPAPIVEPRPDLTVVRRRRARRSLMTKFGVLAFVALFVSVLGVVVFQTLRAQNQTRLDDLDRQVSAEQDRGKSLRLQLATAEAPDRIAALAQQRLGMIPPNDVAYLQPKADDDAHAAWDPQKDPVPTTTVPTTTPPATTPVTTAPATQPQYTWTPPTTVKAPAGSTPTTTKSPTTTTKTPTTTAKPTTTPTTAAPTVTTAPGTKR
jgi:cell division protein FtsL